MKKKFTFFIISLISLVYWCNIWAFDRNVSSAFFFKVPYLEAPATVYTITSEELQDFGIKKISDILKYFSNIMVLPSDRHLDRIYIRGIGAKYNNRILLLINGVPIREPVYQHAFIDEFIAIENIKLVELIIGPTSALFGTNSLAGAINIITYAPENKKFSRLGGIVGSDATKGLYVRGNLTNEDDLKVNYFAKYYSSYGEGPYLPYKAKYPTLFLNNDPSEVHQFEFSSIFKNFKFDIGYTEYKNKYTIGYDFPTWQETFFRYRSFFITATYRRHFSSSTFIESLLYNQYYDDDNLWYKFSYSDTGYLNFTTTDVITPLKISNIFGNSTRIYYIKKFPALRHQLVAGYNIENIRIFKAYDIYYTSTGDIYKPYYITPINENVVSLFGEYGLITKQFKTIGNIRIDRYKEFGFTLNPRIFISYRPTNPIILKLMAGQAFRAPSARELYTITDEFHQGNPELKPEKIFTPEFSISYIKSRIRSNITFFYNRFWDFITTESYDTAPYINHVKGENYGVEWNSYFFAFNQRLNFNLSYIDGTDTTLYTVPKFKLSLLHCIYLTKNLTINFAYQYYSEILKCEDRLPDIFLINGFIDFKIPKGFVKIGVENILNSECYLPNVKMYYQDYKMPGRKVYLIFGLSL